MTRSLWQWSTAPAPAASAPTTRARSGGRVLLALWIGLTLTAIAALAAWLEGGPEALVHLAGGLAVSGAVAGLAWGARGCERPQAAFALAVGGIVAWAAGWLLLYAARIEVPLERAADRF